MVAVRCGGLAVRGQPRQARRRRGVGVRPLAPHVDAINANGLRLTGAGEVTRVRATTDRPSSRRATSGSSRRRRCTPRRDRGDGARLRGRRRRLGPERRRQRGGHRSSRHARDPRHDLSGRGKILEPGVVQWDVKGDTTLGPVRAEPGARDEIERLADACTRAACRRTRSLTPAPRSGARSSSTPRRTRSARSPA